MRWKGKTQVRLKVLELREKGRVGNGEGKFIGRSRWDGEVYQDERDGWEVEENAAVEVGRKA